MLRNYTYEGQTLYTPENMPTFSYDMVGIKGEVYAKVELTDIDDTGQYLVIKNRQDGFWDVHTEYLDRVAYLLFVNIPGLEDNNIHTLMDLLVNECTTELPVYYEPFGAE